MPAPYTLFIVSRNSAYLDAITAALGDQQRIVVAADGDAASALLASLDSPGALACVLLDSPDGLALLPQVRQIHPRAQCLLVTDLANAATLNQADVDRFIFQPSSVDDWLLQLNRAIGQFDQQRKLDDRLRAYSTQLEEACFNDTLTGLRTRQFLLEHLTADASLTLRRYNNWHGNEEELPVDADWILYLIDFDNFQRVNQLYGHAAGDSLLRQTRQRLERVFRDSDYLVRWGGETFLVVARATARYKADDLAERVRASFADEAFVLDNGTPLHKTCSVGFACFPFMPHHPRALDWQEVLQIADIALCAAKRSGRDGWVGISPQRRTRPQELLKRIGENPGELLQQGELRIATSLDYTAVADALGQLPDGKA